MRDYLLMVVTPSKLSLVVLFVADVVQILFTGSEIHVHLVFRHQEEVIPHAIRPSEEDLNNIGNKQNHQRQFTGGHHHKEDDRSDDNDGDDGAADNAGRRRGGHVEGDCEVRDCAGLEDPRSVRGLRSQQLRTIFVCDFCLGATIQQNIVHATDNSSRSIFVLSHQTAENDWFNFAFHVTFDSYLQLCDYRVALVSREEMVVRKFTGEVQQVVQTLSLLWEADP
ncbi:hypothetical protein ACOMHN_045885 [Nucella lapillus]